MLWERAADAAVTKQTLPPRSSMPTAPAIITSSAARPGRPPAPRPSPGGRCATWGRHAEAREQLTAAVKVLRADPDTDTVRALEELAALEVFAGSPDADRLTTEALILGQALGVGAGQLSRLFMTRGIYLCSPGGGPKAAAYFREGARLATQAGDNVRWDARC